MPSNFKVLSGASGEPNDPNFKNVTLLLHGDGSNGAQNNTFIDSSTNNFTITRNGNTTQGSFSPYGDNWSNYFDGSGDYLEIADNAAFDFGTGNFTIEFWMFAQNLASTPMFFHKGSNTAGWFCQTTASTFYFGQLDSNRYTTWSVSLSDNAWYHIALTRVGSSLNVFINGVSQTAKTVSGADASNDNANNVVIGRIASGSYQFQGYLSNYRIVKGTAVYTSNFTPSTTPLTAITNTSLLTCQSNRFRDGSTNNFIITPNGGTRVTNFSPFAPSSAYSTSTNGGSAYFDGSGDYLSAPSNTAFDCGTGDWTFEAWVYISTRTNNYPVIFGNNRGSWTTDALALTVSNADNAAYNDKFVFGWNNGGFTSPSAGTSQLLVASSTNSNNTWYHFAVVRNGTSIKMYRNGTEVASATISSGATFNWGYNGALIGGGNWDGAASYYNGFISNLRLIKGTAVYTAAFTPPTSPVTAITNTSLLTNFTNAAIFDNSMKNDLETVGNAQISTSVKKFGTGSMYFDGSGDYLYLGSNQDLGVGTGDFTIEAWIYPTGGTGNRAIFSGNVTNAMAFYINTSGKIAVAKSGVVEIIASTTTISTSAFTYVAATRSGNTFRIFVNGTLEATVTSSQDFTSFSDNRVGYESGSSYYQGYIDDLRITKGVARYTANFTAPTAPFPNK